MTATDCVMLSRKSSSASQFDWRINLLDLDKIREKLLLRANDIYDPFKAEQDQTMILDKYREDGYITARVLPRLEKKSEQEYRLTYVARTPKVFLTDVDINANQSVRGG